MASSPPPVSARTGRNIRTSCGNFTRHASVPVLVYSMQTKAKEQPSKRLQNKVDNNAVANTIFTMFVVVINMLGHTESMNVATPTNKPVST